MSLHMKIIVMKVMKSRFPSSQRCTCNAFVLTYHVLKSWFSEGEGNVTWKIYFVQSCIKIGLTREYVETKLLLQFIYLNLPYPNIPLSIYIFIYMLHLIKIAISISDVRELFLPRFLFCSSETIHF